MLTNKLINNSITKASQEALKNAHYLLLAGFTEAAYEITTALISEGVWQVNPHTHFINDVIQVHELACWLLGKPLPQIADEEALTVSELNDEAFSEWKRLALGLISRDRMQTEPAGTSWNSHFFTELEKMQPDEHGMFKQFGLFESDVEWVVKNRLHHLLKEKGEFAHLMNNGEPQMFLGGKIAIANTALAYDIHELADVLASCSEKFLAQIKEKHIGYMEVNIFQSMLIIDLINENAQSAHTQLKRLLNAEDMYDVTRMLYCPWFKAFVNEGEVAQSLGINQAAVTEYLQAFHQRKPPTSPPKKSTQAKKEQPNFISLADLKPLIKGTPLGKLNKKEANIPEYENSLITIKITDGKTSEQQLLSLWKQAYDLIKQTNRYPVIIMDWGDINKDDWSEFATRFPYSEEMYEGERNGVNALDILDSAEGANLQQFYADRENRSYEDIDFTEIADYDFGIEDIDLVKQLSEGLAPDTELSVLTFSQRAMQWLSTNNKLPKANAEEIIQWFIPTQHDDVYLLLLPCKHVWEVPAFLHFYGAGMYGTEILIAQLKAWHENYGIDIIMSLGTMLNIQAQNLPDDDISAVQLAYQQNALAECTYTTSGYSMSEYAMALKTSKKWFLHERP